MRNYFFTFCLALLCFSVVACSELSNPIKVKYEITGTASSVNVTTHNAQGNTEQLSDVSVPWSTDEFISEWSYHSDGGTYYAAYISATNNSDSGSVTVKIYVNNKEFQTATSSGAYVTVTASGKIYL
jgi:hypothetical protein